MRSFRKAPGISTVQMQHDDNENDTRLPELHTGDTSKCNLLKFAAFCRRRNFIYSRRWRVKLEIALTPSDGCMSRLRRHELNFETGFSRRESGARKAVATN